MRYFLIFLFSLTLATNVFYWLPRAELVNTLEELITENMPGDLKGPLTEHSNEQLYFRAIGYLLPAYEKSINLRLGNWERPTIGRCQIQLHHKTSDEFSLWTRHLSTLDGKLSLIIYPQCSTRWRYILLFSLTLAAGSTYFIYLLPKPYSQKRHHWINRLITEGYGIQDAIAATSSLDDKKSPSDVQIDSFFNLHQEAERNFSNIVQLAADHPTLTLTPEESEWFSRAKEHHATEQALTIAKADDRLIIDLNRSRVTIHGWQIEIPKTPLFYYTWYALRRQQGDGWLENPRTNRSDMAQGQKLAQLMWNHNGHAKAISDLETNGLRSKILDQNRSKIKEEIVCVLGKVLAKPYLFEKIKAEGSDQSSYRLALPSNQIEVLQ